MSLGVSKIEGGDRVAEYSELEGQREERRWDRSAGARLSQNLGFLKAIVNRWGRIIGGQELLMLKTNTQGFPGSAVVKNPPANAGDTGSSPGLGRSHMPRSN